MTVKDAVEYYVVLFNSVSYALKSEKILKKENIPFKLIPVPKSISSDCGVCIRFTPENRGALINALEGKVEYNEIRRL
ncbi:MAG TPA: DUF3343 domain-containing protein [Spirochaetota bacterium]|nr:DUF3343 domain-containing protein [Spirochaetota bacterium]HPF07369.1 DUF3343 domain-containing protein [Spirochaetota bacterium]HPJ43656.1 DUF3343 domain-containing protein [Spirochaetota bacterium]HPR38550.1 DUF3343 domain-containing protein [Spirochaetota bacterium]HRX48533.1 DUF3343 domain-containing protein [Spirochaetota bacterium]